MRFAPSILWTLALLILAGIAAARWATRELQFDAARWAAGGPALRFRMKESLERRYAAGELATKDAVDRELGRGDWGEYPNYRSFRLERWYTSRWFLHIRWDERGKVVELAARPD